MQSVVTAAMPAPQPNAPELPAGDWDALFDAVIGRLHQGAAVPGAGPDTLAALAVDCACALEQLKCLRAAERERLRALQGFESPAALKLEHDHLTLLPRLSFFSARLNEALGVDMLPLPGLAVLLLDLDDFKPINDRHGHDTGDEMLRIVAHRLSRAVRAGDIICRIGGDEFACLMPQPMDREQLSHLAAKLFDIVSAPLKIGVLELSVRPSIGIAMAPTDGQTAAALLQRADQAMLHAKRRQLGYAFFEARNDPQ
jgi:diguanylate cyclase (GGDEF)-like protein